jgi:hypothetical protein
MAYLVLEPAPSQLAYGSLLGWSGALVVPVVIIQGVRKIEKRPSPQSKEGLRRAGFAMDRWGAFHTALSIALTVIVLVHGLLFVGGLFGPNFPVWLGALAVGSLLVLDASGVATEAMRKSRRFGPLRRVHVVLMVTVAALTLAHIELLVAGPFVRTMLQGAIVAFLVIAVVFVGIMVSVAS